MIETGDDDDMIIMSYMYMWIMHYSVFQLDREYNEFRLHSIMSEHKKTITAISWNSKNRDLIVTSGADALIVVWNVSLQKAVAKLENTKGVPCSMGWCFHEKDCIAFVYGRGPLLLWNYCGDGTSLSAHTQATNFMSDVCQFRWHHKKMGKLAFGHMDGSISFFCPGTCAML